MAALMNSYGRLPVTMVDGQGALLHDTEGREYIDAVSGIAVCSLGHANPAVTAAIAEQAGRLMHVSNLYHIAEQEALGERLCSVAGMDKAFFCNSGAEANEALIKIARLHGHHRGIATPTIIVTEQSFHGRTLATLTATGSTKVQQGFGPLVQGFVRVPYNDTEAVAQLLAERDDIVAVLVEPVQGEGGVNVPASDYLDRLRELCDRHQALLLLDEIQTGMGRTGRWFGHQHGTARPDAMSVAKALGNGMPIGACLARGATAELIQPGSHGTTFGGNPLACRAALTVIDEIEKHDLVARAAELGERMLDGLRSALHNQPGVIDIRGKGLMLAVALDRPCGALVTRALEAGLLINVTADSVVRLLPPLILSDAQADDIVARTASLITTFLSESTDEESN